MTQTLRNTQPWSQCGDGFKTGKGAVDMLLNDTEITALCTGDAPMIAPFAEGAKRPGVISYGVTSFGYDMRVADEWGELIDGWTHDPKNVKEDEVNYYNATNGVVTIEPGSFILCRSVEYFRIPENVLAIVVGKSTYARCGLIVNCTPMEPGWHGHLTIELHNASRHSIRVYANEGIAQAVFYRGNRPAVTYADKQGKYQGQTGVTLGKVE